MSDEREQTRELINSLESKDNSIYQVLQKHADDGSINKKLNGYYIIHYVLCFQSENSLDVIKYMINLGADLNVEYEEYEELKNKKDKRNMTPLIFAIINNNSLKIIELLLNGSQDVCGANIEYMGYGYTPLILAETLGNKDVFKLLLEHGADYSRVAKKGFVEIVDHYKRFQTAKSVFKIFKNNIKVTSRIKAIEDKVVKFLNV
jgi:hypothetical protein